MPWISRTQLTHIEDENARLRQQNDDQLERILTCIALVQHGVDWTNRKLPDEIVAKVREAGVADVLARAAIKADAEAQPLSIEAADKARVREARERQRETR